MSSMFDYEDIEDPASGQKVQAMLLRKQSQERLRAANEEANKYNTLAAVSQMANNKGLAGATEMMAKNQQAQHKPINLGQMGFAMPGTGDFISSPMYEDEKNAQRQAQKETVLARTAAAAEAARIRQEGIASEHERDRTLKTTLATMLENGRNSRNDAKIDAKGEAGGKILPASNVEKLSKQQGTAAAFLDLHSTYKDDYAGTPGLADAQNFGGRFGVGKYADQSNWWQNYQEQINQTRHQLFGSALTATEKAAFDKAVVVPGMDAMEIKRRLAQQAKAVTQAYNKLKVNYGKAGYNVGNFEDMVGPEDVPLPGKPVVPPAATPPAAGLKIPGLNLPPGFTVVGEAK